MSITSENVQDLNLDCVGPLGNGEIGAKHKEFVSFWLL